jgi:hypothetical protein
MTTISINRQCDNFDHTGPHADLQAVTLREEYGSSVVDWCDACRERDADMIVPECGNCGRPLTEDDENALVSETVNRCSRCLYLERGKL